MANRYDDTAELLRSAWEKAANHEKLSFGETNALRFAYQTFDKIVQAGELLQDSLDDDDENDGMVFIE